MADAIDAALAAAEQPSSAFLAACTSLLLAIATNSVVVSAEVDVLLDAMPDVDLRDGLRVGLRDHGLWGDEHIAAFRVLR